MKDPDWQVVDSMKPHLNEFHDKEQQLEQHTENVSTFIISFHPFFLSSQNSLLKGYLPCWQCFKRTSVISTQISSVQQKGTQSPHSGIRQRSVSRHRQSSLDCQQIASSRKVDIGWCLLILSLMIFPF